MSNGTSGCAKKRDQPADSPTKPAPNALLLVRRRGFRSQVAAVVGSYFGFLMQIIASGDDEGIIGRFALVENGRLGFRLSGRTIKQLGLNENGGPSQDPF